MMRSIRFFVGAVVLAVLAVPTVAEAGYYHVFELKNHLGGSANPPPYGLRLDGLFTRNQHDTFTFDFEHASIAESDRMKLWYNVNNSHIVLEGTVYGGLVEGDDTTPYENYEGKYDVFFEYTAGITATYDGSELASVAVDQNQSQNTGWIKGPGANGTKFLLVDQGDSSGNSFNLSFDQKHRGEKPAGWGWLNHAEEGKAHHLGQHLYASDWLFTVGDEVRNPPPPPPNPVPEPGSLAIFGISALGLFTAARRRRRSERCPCPE